MNHRPLHVLQGDPGLPGVPATSGSPFRIGPLRVYPPTQVHVVVHLSKRFCQQDKNNPLLKNLQRVDYSGHDDGSRFDPTSS